MWGCLCWRPSSGCRSRLSHGASSGSWTSSRRPSSPTCREASASTPRRRGGRCRRCSSPGSWSVSRFATCPDVAATRPPRVQGRPAAVARGPARHRTRRACHPRRRRCAGSRGAADRPGRGLGILAVQLIKPNAPQAAQAVIAAAGSFAAISTLLGSPLAGAFLLMEVAGLGRTDARRRARPGLLAAGVGSLIFIGLDSWTGFGTFSLAIPDIPTSAADRGRVRLGDRDRARRCRRSAAASDGWRCCSGRRRAETGVADARGRNGGRRPGDRVRRVSDHATSHVLFSGQNSSAADQQAGSWTVGALVLLVVCKGLAYGVSLSAFRGGPMFPGMFIGAVGGIAALAPSRCR